MMADHSPRRSALTDDPHWYRDAIIYEVPVRAFRDANGDGVGDFAGLTESLDYIQDLGVTALWLLPFYPSPLKDDGYDIADYRGVHPDYGTLREFKEFLQAAHRRGVRVVTELVLNHTSDQHPWFERARVAPAGSRRRDFYVWADAPEPYREARVIFQDFESSNWAWDQRAGSYYWHRFYSHQPDLNFENPDVRLAMLRVVDFWLGLGVDGLRLDAVPYLYERDGTTCENIPETHAFLRTLRDHVDQRFKNRMLLAEANQWPEDAVAYFGAGDECHMAFHFPVMPRLFMAIHMEDRFPIIDILEQTPPLAEGCQWVLFLRNHDELTLEMVTDEERDYMYRVYAHDRQTRINLGIRRRLAPLLGNNRRRIELMNGLLLSLPGTPVIYYGDEIGMGDNIYLGDRNGVRTPMQWSPDRNAGFSLANPQRLYLPPITDSEYHCEAVNVEVQQSNPSSLLWWMKRLIALRKQYRAFSRGDLKFISPENRKVLAFVRRYEAECILVVANLSRFVQAVSLDLSDFRGMEPIELFGRTRFPPVGDSPYLLTLGPHAFYWFVLEEQPTEIARHGSAGGRSIPVLTATGAWRDLLQGARRARLEQLLPGYLAACRWFGGKGRAVRSVTIAEALPLPQGAREVRGYLTLLNIVYREGEPETWVLPIGFARGDMARRLLDQEVRAVIAEVRGEHEGDGGVLFDALWDSEFCEAILDTIGRRRHLKGERGELVGGPTRVYRQLRGPATSPLASSMLGADQSNTSIQYEQRFVFKLFRQVREGTNPDLEIGRLLTESRPFPHVPPLAGALEYHPRGSEPVAIGALCGFVPNEGDAWHYTLDSIGRYFEAVLAQPPDTAGGILGPEVPLLTLVEEEPPPLVEELMGDYLRWAELLGERLAQLHLALASETEDPSFAPEPFTAHYQRSLCQSMRSLTVRTLQLLRSQLPALPESSWPVVQRVLEQENDILQRFRRILDRKVVALRSRGHGDCHLGQVLYTGKDFVFIDFEGEPARTVSERRLKRSSLRDVAGMIRSFHYAAYTALSAHAESGVIRPVDRDIVRPWAQAWYVWAAVGFLRSYIEALGPSALLPPDRGDLEALLDGYLLEKAVYELGYELNSRPDWAQIPMLGILQLLEASGNRG